MKNTRILSLEDKNDGIQGVRYQVNRIVDLKDNRPEGTITPEHLVRLPIFPNSFCMSAPGQYLLSEPGLYETIANYWSADTLLPYCRVYTYFAYRRDGDFQEVPFTQIPDEVSATPFPRVVEFPDWDNDI